MRKLGFWLILGGIPYTLKLDLFIWTRPRIIVRKCSSLALAYFTNQPPIEQSAVNDVLPHTWGSPDTINIQFSVPIVGWSFEKTNIRTLLGI